jgi:hypothetical protein
MKRLIMVICAGLSLAGCKKNGLTPQSGYKQNKGIIVGYSARMCPEVWCGGLRITILNDTGPAGHYIAEQSLSQLGLSEQTALPVNVVLNWKLDTGQYKPIDLISISGIKITR